MSKELRILMLEDRSADAELVTRELRAQGIQFRAKRVLSEADFLEQLSAFQPELILADYALPGYDGIAALAAVRKLQPELPFIFVSGTLGEETAIEALHYGATDYVLKHRLARLGPAVRRAMRESQQRRDRARAEKQICDLNLLLRAIRGINQLIIREREPRLLLAQACEILVQTRGYHFAWVGRAEPDSHRVVAAGCAGKGAGYLEAITVTWDETPTGLGPVGTALRTGQIQVCQDTATDPRFAPWKDAALSRGFASVASVPLRHGTPPRETLTVYSGHPEAFADEELRLLDELAADLALAMHSIEGEKQRQHAEAAVGQRETELRDAESLYHSLVENLPQGVFRQDRAGRFTYVNRHFCALMGRPPQELLGRTVFDLFPPEVAERYRQDDERVLQRETVLDAIEERMPAGKPGTVIHVLKAPIRSASGEIIGVQGIFTDITSQRELEAKFLRAQRLESIGSLSSGIAHDLNNILAPILMCAPLLHGELTAEEHEQMVSLIEASGQRAVGIVKQLLSFGRGQSGQRAALPVRHLLREVGKIAQETFPRSIQVEQDIPPDLWLVIGDSTRLHQVLLNLCVNARDAMPAGGKLTVRAENVMLDEQYVSQRPGAAPGPFVRIQVQDTGTGIPESAREHIFESFFTTKGQDQGTGLGLTTVLGIVKEHQGFITFSTAEGQGTTFEFHLPAVVETPSALPPEGPGPVVPLGRGELILLVDDEPSIRAALRRTLERQGYAVLQAQDGIDALAQFTARPAEIKAVITDFMMPQMDGVMLARTLRRLSPDTPIIVSSGGLLDKIAGNPIEAFGALGIHHILHKPHGAKVLLEALNAVLHPESRPKPG